MLLLCVCAALLCAGCAPTPKAALDQAAPASSPQPAAVFNEAALDAVLQQAATDALGAQAGAIVVLDPQTGRVRAAVNLRGASQEAFPPGSVVKPFTLLTALRTGALDSNARLLCRKHYRRADADFTCSHPASLPPFTPAQALAYSCNYFFARLGERLRADDFSATLTAYGFGARTGQPDEFEQAGQLPRGRWRVPAALGEDEQLLVTPVQLVTAYAALLNGGWLYTPQPAPPDNFQPHTRAHLDLTTAERALLVEGLRGAIAYGTAERAHMDALPVAVYGKTGTATEVGGVHTHGWFVGFAADAAPPAQLIKAQATQTEQSDAPNEPAQTSTLTHEQADAPAHTFAPAPAQFKLAVVVFLKRATGAQSANVAKPVFAAYARALNQTPFGANASSQTPARADAAHAAEQARLSSSLERAPLAGSTDADAGRSGEPLVRVHLVREDETRALALDDYIFGVLAAEASTEDEYEAIKALAVTSRTFALRNLRRHARAGYDFCNLTHCQRYLAVNNTNARPEFHALLRRAVRETAGEVLRDGHNQLVNAYFSASCGGMTADVSALWGVPARERYERGVRDEFCAGLPNSSWTDTLAAEQIARALHEDERGDVGAHLEEIRVVRRSRDGRAERLEVRGERRRMLSGWEFKTIVGRTLGWNVLKSSRFTVERAGAQFVFRGSGFGHGLGLCQMGAHAQAERGASYRQILAYYFPGTRLVPFADVAQWHDDVLLDARGPTSLIAPRAVASKQTVAVAPRRLKTPAAPAAAASPAPLTLASERFRVSYPPQVARRDAEEILRTLEAARADLRQRLAAASLALPTLPVIEVTAHETTGDFVGATGQAPWAAAATRGRRIHLQPPATLRRRGVLQTTLRHEYAHAVIDALGRGRTPRWLAEGLAAYTAGEGPLLTRVAAPKQISTDELERKLAEAPAADEMRALYAAAYRAVAALVQKEGEANVWRRVASG